MTHEELISAIRQRNFRHAEFQELLCAIENKAASMSADFQGMSEVTDHLTDAWAAMDGAYFEAVSADEYREARRA